jgi:hypothetical protein
MAEQNKLNRGVLFTNKKKEKDTHPDYTGSFTDASGNEFWVSAWINKSKAGETYMSFNTKSKDDAPAPKKGEWKTLKKEENDDLPF